MQGFRSILVSGLLLLTVNAAALAGELYEGELQVDNRWRSFTVYEPDSAAEPMPVLLVLHGGLGNADYTQRYGLNDIADREGFLVVYPEGTPIGRGGLLTRNRLVWNAGDCCAKAARDKVDDVHFIDQLLDYLTTDYSVDESRLYVTGMSNGGMMTYRLVCELPGRFAAAAPVAAALVSQDCHGDTAVALLHIHGDADANVPLEGGQGDIGLVDLDYPSLNQSLLQLAAGRNCAMPVTEVTSNGDRHIQFHCLEGEDVSAQILAGVEHTWPGKSLRNKQGGNTDAGELVWQFVSSHARTDAR